MCSALGIVGSPRKKGNTAFLVREVLRGVRASGMDTEIVYLADLVIGECDGCHACWEGSPCTKKDGMQALYPVIAESEAIVFGTPVYWFGPTALMKLFLDRFVYFNCRENRKAVKGTRALLVSPFEDDDKETAHPLVSLFEKSVAYLEMTLSGTLLVPGVTRPGDVKEHPGTLRRAFESGQSLAQG